MPRRGFDPNSLLWRPLGYVGDLFMLSLLWALCSAPLVTLGAATAALYDTTAHCLRRGEGDMFGRFFRSFRTDLLSSVLSTLLWAGLLALLFFLRGRMMAATGLAGLGGAAAMLTLILLLIPLGMACWCFPLLSRFRFGFAALCVTTLRLALSQILRTMALGASALGFAWLCLRYALPVMILPAALTLFWTVLIEPVFARYEQRAAGSPSEED